MDNLELRAELEKLHDASFGWALSCCRQHRGEAEDVLQTAYLKILTGKAQYNGDSTFKTWLFAVIRNTALDVRRQVRQASWRLLDIAKGDGLQISPDSVARQLDQAELSRQFQRALRKLPERQRAIVHLVFYQDLTIEEAAVVMNIAIGTARTHYERGKRRLRQLIDLQD